VLYATQVQQAPDRLESSSSSGSNISVTKTGLQCNALQRQQQQRHFNRPSLCAQKGLNSF
jgi:hypothetical protein